MEENMSTTMLIAIGLFLFAFIFTAICGVLGTLEAIDNQNKLAKWRRENDILNNKN
jgi:hypothetical protein